MDRVLVVTFLYSLLLPLATAQLAWARLTPGGDVPTPRSGFSFEYDYTCNCIYLFGGGGDTKTYMFNISTENWSIVHQANDSSSTVPPSLLYAFSGIIRLGNVSLFVVSHGFTGEIISHGFNGGAEFQDTWVFNTGLRTWSKVTVDGTIPSIRYGGHYGVYNNSNELWLGGGFTKTTSLWTRYIDTYILQFNTPKTATWTRVYDQPSTSNQFNPLAPHGRCLQASAVVDPDNIVVWGGCMRSQSGGGPCPADDSWYFNKHKKTWTELPRCATPRLWSAMAPLLNSPGKALLYGGSTTWSEQVLMAEEWPQEEVFVLDINDRSWTRYKSQSHNGEFPTRRFEHKIVGTGDGTIYMFGGRDISGSQKLNDLWTLTGDPSKSNTISCISGWINVPHIHGICMAVAFGILFPTGFFIPRFFRCKGKAWFNLHVIIQISAIILTNPAFIVIFLAGANAKPTHPHAVIGIVLVFLLAFQPINGIFRPSIEKGKKKTFYRIAWEWFHRLYGVAVILMGFVQISLGVFLIVPPRGVWIAWILMMFAWFLLFFVLEVIKWFRVLCCHDNIEYDTMKDEEIELKNK